MQITTTTNFEGIVIESFQNKSLGEKRKKNELSLSDMRDNIKRSEICVTGIPEVRERERQRRGNRKYILKIMAKMFSNLTKSINPQYKKI